MNKIMTAIAAGLLVTATAMAAPGAYARPGGNGQIDNSDTGTAHFEAEDHFEHYRLGDADVGAWHGRRNFPGGLAAYSGAPAYAAGCGWLRREAVTTDSPYWWHRYHRCLNG